MTGPAAAGSAVRRAAGMLLVAAACAGCAAPKVWVTVRPRFDYRAIRTIAVLPFDNPSEYPDAERIVAEKIIALLVERGPYRIVSGTDLDAPALPPGAIDHEAVAAIGRATGADAVLAGTVVQFRGDRFHEVRFYGTPFRFDEALHEAYYDEVPVDWYKIDGVVEAGIRLVDCATGRVIWADARTGTASSYGAPPPMGEAEVLDRAADAAARKLLLGLVPHEERVRVPAGSIFTCADFIDHPMDIRSEFTPGDAAVVIVVELDRNFAGKEVEVALQRDGRGAPLSQQRHAWGDEEEAHPFREETAALLAKGGPGKYRATCFIDGRRIAHADFHLREE